MKLAVNYSLPASKLAMDDHLPIDYFKCPDWPWMVEEAAVIKPVAVHFTLNAGSGRLDKTDWLLVENLLQQTGTSYVNIHIDPLNKDFPDLAVDTTDRSDIRSVTERLIHDVSVVVDRFGAERVIAENVTYYGADDPKIASHDKTMRPGVLPEVIHQLLDETGCGLLLDIPHARIASYYLGMDEGEYFSSLPVDRIKEMHVTGLTMQDNGYLLDHLAMYDPDWIRLDWVLERIHQGDWSTPWMLAFEYGGVGKKFEKRCDPVVISSQLPELAQRLNIFHKE